ncbi:hypothetical protein [Castellaniella sp.]|uniref:phage tail terminator protein n=1 Tax=Castellaniella sp. TaxID=1955812 RepID=UPI002AFF6690|nr:hypothetical protein [Castellaniella sp.]
MSATAIRAALVALLAGIPDIGRVHAYERFSGTDKGFQELYRLDTGRVQGWRISRMASGSRLLASGRTLTTSPWAVVGMLALLDAEQSEIVAGDLADAIIAMERADPTLGGIVRGHPVDGAAGMQLLAIEPVMFAGVLCHKVSLQLDVQALDGAGTDMLAGLPSASGRLISAVVERLQAQNGAGLFTAIEGRLAYDRDDDPAAQPAAIVVPVADYATADPETIQSRQRVDRSVAVIILAPSGFPSGQGALAAGGLEVLRDQVRTALIGWGDGAGGVVDVPLLYAGGSPVDAAPGLIAWRDVFTPSIFLEV